MAFLNPVLVFLISVLIPSVIFGQRSPSISYITQERTKDIGDSLELECAIQNAKDYSIIWYYREKSIDDDRVYLSTGSALITKDLRFSIRYDPSITTYTLQIKDLKETDAGVYTCMILISVVKKVEADVNVTIKRPPIADNPQQIADNISSSISVAQIKDVGSSIELECFVENPKDHVVMWIKTDRDRSNGIFLSAGINTLITKDSRFSLRYDRSASTYALQIKDLKETDSGVYECQILVSVTKQIKANVEIRVRPIPQVILVI